MKLVKWRPLLDSDRFFEAFLDSEVERYADQLARYADAMARIDERPLRVGLYFPLLQTFRSWSPNAAS